MPGDQGGGGVHQGQEAVPVTPTNRPGRPVCEQDQQGGEVPGDHQGAGGGGVHQGQEAVAVQQSVECTPSKLCKLVAEPEES